MSVVSLGWAWTKNVFKVFFCSLCFPCYFLPPQFCSKWWRNNGPTCRGWGSNKQIEWIREAWWPTSHQTKCSLSLIETRSEKRAWFSLRRASCLSYRTPQLSLSLKYCNSLYFPWWCVLGPVLTMIFQRRSVLGVGICGNDFTTFGDLKRWCANAGVATPTRHLHSLKLTWHQKMGAPWKRRFILETIICIGAKPSFIAPIINAMLTLKTIICKKGPF